MFGDVAKFSDKEFFDQHRYGSIYYNGVEKGLEIFEMLEVDAYDFNIYDPGINGDDRRQEYIDHLLSVAIHKRDITLGPNDHIILLSTCFLDVTNGRHIVVAKITDTVPKNTFHTKNQNHSLIVSLMIRRSDDFSHRFLCGYGTSSCLSCSCY